MRRWITTMVVAVGLSLAFVPGAVGGNAGHTYNYQDTITADVPGAYATSNAHDYTIDDVPPGTPISASVTWDNPDVDVELTLQEPGGTCDILPEPEPLCIVGLVAGNVEQADCGGADEPDLIDDQTDEASTTTEVAGPWTVSVAADRILPTQSVTYDLTFTVGEEHGAVTGPEDTNYVHTTPQCSLVE